MGYVVVSQFGAAFDERLRAARPDVQVRALVRGGELSALEGADVMLALPFRGDTLQAPAPPAWPWALRWVQLISVGVDGYPRWFLDGGVHVTTAKGTSAETIAEYVLAAVLQRALRLEERRVTAPEQWRFTPAPGVAGQTLGLFGFGGIGRATAQRALALGMHVLATRRSDGDLGMDGVVRVASLRELAARSDHLALVAPATAQTQHAFDADVVARARAGLHVINVARGSLLDQDALQRGLDDHRIGFATLDVTEPEPLPAGHWLYSHPRVRVTPHTCAIGPRIEVELLARVLKGLDALDDGRLPEGRVDLALGY